MMTMTVTAVAKVQDFIQEHGVEGGAGTERFEGVLGVWLAGLGGAQAVDHLLHIAKPVRCG